MMRDETNRFDEALRVHHRVALEQVSPKVRAQLSQRRVAALRGAVPRRRHGLAYAAAGFAVLGALAIGLQFRTPPEPASTPTVTSAAAIDTVSPARAVGTMLDDDPDFYAWLASSDAMQVAME